MFADPRSGDQFLWAIAVAGLIGLLALSAWLVSRRATVVRSARLLGRLVPRRLAPTGFSPQDAGDWHARLKTTVGTPRNRVVLVVMGISAWLADITCLALALQAVGVRVHPQAVAIAYVTGVAVAMLPLLPGGIGVVEAAVPAVLHRFGAPLDLALAGTLVYRGLAFVLPAAGGASFLAATRLARRT